MTTTDRNYGQNYRNKILINWSEAFKRLHGRIYKSINVLLHVFPNSMTWLIIYSIYICIYLMAFSCVRMCKHYKCCSAPCCDSFRNRSYEHTLAAPVPLCIALRWQKQDEVWRHTHTETYTYQQMKYVLSSHKHHPLRMWQSYLTVKLDSEPPLETCREETWNTCSIISRLIENSVGGPAPCESTQQGFVRCLDTTQINTHITYVNQCTESHRSSTPTG